MLEQYYGLTRDPFKLNPDRHFCFGHPTYSKARAYLKYALDKAEGFAVITGDPGTGKTTLIEELMAEISGDSLEIVNIVNARLNDEELLRMLAYGLSLPIGNDDEKPDLLHAIIARLKELASDGKRVVVIVDEAQGLGRAALEELRLLSNQAMDGKPLMQILLVGQRELKNNIYQQGMEQFQQRIIVSCDIQPLSLEETEEYIKHRLSIAGWSGTPQLEQGIYRYIHAYSKGIPRRINLLCSRLLLSSGMNELQTISVEDVEDVIEELGEEIHYSQEQIMFEDAALLQSSSPAVEEDDAFEQEAATSSSEESLRGERIGASNVIQLRTNTASTVLPKGPVNKILIKKEGEEVAAAPSHEAVAQPASPRGSIKVLGRFLALSLAVLSIGAATDAGGQMDVLRARVSSVWHEVESFVKEQTGLELGLAPQEEGDAALTDDLAPATTAPATSVASSGGGPEPSIQVGQQTATASPAGEGQRVEGVNADRPGKVQVATLDPGGGVQSISSLNDDYFLNDKVWIIPFYVDSAKPRKDKEKELREIADVALRHKDKRIYVIGYADSSGPKGYNLALSKRRARNVARALVENGVDVDQVIVEGKGSVEAGLLGSGLHFGRRVEVYFEE